MPPTSQIAQTVLQERIVIIPHDGQKPTIWPFVFALAGITGFAIFSALVGCLAARCCRKTGNQKLIEKKVVDDIERAQRKQNASISTVADDEDDMIEQRTANIMATDAFTGREQKLAANQKKVQFNQSWKTYSIMLPVTLAELKKLAVRSVSSCGGGQLEPQQARPASQKVAVPPFTSV